MDTRDSIHGYDSDTFPPWAACVLRSGGKPLSFSYLNSAYQYLRSTLNLLERSRKVKSSKLLQRIELRIKSAFEKETLLTPLEIESIIHSLIRVRLGPERPYSMRQARLGISRSRKRYEEEELEKGVRPDDELSAYLKDCAGQTRRNEWIYRVVNETERAIGEKWFVLFGTYTVDPSILPSKGLLHRDELFTETPAWDTFMRQFKTEIADSLGYGRKPAKWPPTSTFYRYFAVLEHGSSGEHPHVHCLFFVKNIPDAWKHDPNDGNRFNLNVDIPGASALWEHGEQRVTKGLFVQGSWFVENWETPVKYEDGKFIEYTVGAPASVAGYIGKYMGKEGINQWKNGKYHRVKATKSLGLDKVRLALLGCPLRVLLASSSRLQDYSTQMAIQQRTSIPLGLLRRISKMELTKRLHSLRAPLAERYLSKIWTREPSEFYTILLKHVEDGVRPSRMMPSQRYNLFTQIMGEAPSMAHCKPWLRDMAQFLARVFPADVYSNERVQLRTSPT